MRCRSCGTELLPGKAFCHACGARAPQVCGHCGEVVEAGFKFCPNCGQGLETPAAAEAKPATAIPEPLAEKIRGAAQSVGERKQVTVLFCDLAGSTAVASGLDPEVYGELLEQYVALAMHEVYRFEGMINQLSGDGFMALFGAPIAHEDAPQRAVRAALAIRDALAHFNDQLVRERGIALPARIGLNTGPVVVGTVGNDLRMDYTAIGDTTNLAARLEQLATPGTILISEPTARLVRGFFELREVGPLEVKGKAEPVAAYEVLSARAPASSIEIAAERGLTPLVGRTEELAQLEACYDRLAGGYTQVVAVLGEAGSGKSRLIYEFRQKLSERGEPVVFLEGRCAALSQNVPLAPFVALLRQYFDLTPNDSADSACDKVATRLGKSASIVDDAYPLLCRVLSVPAELPADLPLEALKQETFEAIGKLIYAESRRAPVVMILEDLHWIDEPSLELLEMAVARLMRARVLILVSHRSEFRPQWRTSAALTQVHLRPLLEDDVLAIVRSLAGGVLPNELEGRILAKAEGSPFFAEELTRSLSEEGFLTNGGGAVRLTRPVEEILIPGSVREVIAARLDRVRPTAKRVAQLAAVLGRQFRRSELTQLLAPEGIEVDSELGELTRRGVIHRKSLFSDDEYRFGESLTQEVAYDSLLLKQRRQLHGRVATLLEQGSFDPSLARPALIAHHYALSDDRAKAVETLLGAAGEAERLPSFRTALDLYRQAWELGEAALRDGVDDARFRQWVMNATAGYARITVLYGSSADADAERAAVRARELALELGDAATASVQRVMHGMLLTADPSRFAEGVEITEAAVAEQRAQPDSPILLHTTRAVAWHALLDGRFAAARTTLDWLLRELEVQGQRDALTEVYVSSRWMREGVLFASDEFEAAFESATETYALAQRANNHTVQSGSASVLAQVHMVRGEYEQARRWAARSLEVAEQIGGAAGAQRGEALVLAARVALGEAVTLGSLAERLHDGVARGGNMLLSIQSVVEAYLGLGEIKRAERIARLAVERAGGRFREMMATASLADALVRQGPAAWGEAERVVDRASGLAEALGSRQVRVQTLLARARLALARDLSDDARRALSEARALGAAIGLTRYDRLIAVLLSQSDVGLSAAAS
jgi:class 3 adenylate cyclase/tetratricopeptide (TPR) repeat protein